MTAGPDILFCGDPLVPGQFDQHYELEAELVRELGGTVAAIDHDALTRGDPQAAVRRVPRDSGPWWYRGWMVPTVAYENLAQALRDRGVELRVSARRYRTAHELPGWYDTFVTSRRPATGHSGLRERFRRPTWSRCSRPLSPPDRRSSKTSSSRANMSGTRPASSRT